MEGILCQGSSTPQQENVSGAILFQGMGAELLPGAKQLTSSKFVRHARASIRSGGHSPNTSFGIYYGNGRFVFNWNVIAFEMAGHILRGAGARTIFDRDRHYLAAASPSTGRAA